MNSSGRPVVYLDVDGPLNPWAAKPHRRPEGYETHRLLPREWVERKRAENPGARVKPLRVWLNPTHGQELLTVADERGADLVWATTWQRDANSMIGPAIGLPELETVEWSLGETEPDSVLWKTADLVTHADGRPFVWIDDDIGDGDHEYVRREHPGEALLHRVDPAIGLLPGDFEAVSEWLGRLAEQ